MTQYDYDVKKLIDFFLDAQKKTTDLLDSLYKEDKITRAMLISREKQIDVIIKQLETSGLLWADQAMNKAALEGVAETLVSLGLVETVSEALAVASLSATNQAYLIAQIASTQTDILAVTQNMSRQSKSAISQAYANELRAQLASGSNSHRELKKSVQQAIRKENARGIDTAIIDRANRRWKVEDYVDMLLQTKAMEAHREASINAGLEEGALHARISKHGATDACARWEGKTVKLSPNAPGDYPYVGDIPRRELFHPRCKHILSPIFLD